MTEFAVSPRMDTNVCFLGRFNTVCGISTYTENLAEALQKRVDARAVSIASDHAYVYELPKRKSSTVQSIPLFCETGPLMGVLETLELQALDVLHIQHEHGVFRNLEALASLMLSMQERLPVMARVATLHTIREQINELEGSFLSSLHAIIVHSASAKTKLEMLLAGLGKRAPLVRVIPHGTIEPRPALEKAYARRMLGLPENKEHIVILSLGFISIPKQHMLMLQCLEQLKKLSLIFSGQVTLFIAGLPQPKNAGGQQLVDRLRGYAHEHLAPGMVKIHDHFIQEKDLEIYYSAADMTLHLRKGGGYSASGAIRLDLSHRMPVLTTKAGITADLPEDVVMFCHTESDIIYKLHALIKDKEARRRLSMKAEKFANLNNWDHTAGRHMACYKEACDIAQGEAR